jgi:ankyrin repeat protein
VRDGHVPEVIAAVYRGDTKAFAACLRADPQLAQSKDAEGCPVFIRAAENGQEEMVLCLLAHGADIEARGPHGQSALSSCACN